MEGEASNYYSTPFGVRNPYRSTPMTSSSRIDSASTKVRTTNTASTVNNASKSQKTATQQRRHRLRQYITLRDSKRQQLTELFDRHQGFLQEIRRLQEAAANTKGDMKELQQELVALDDDIDRLTEQKQIDLEGRQEAQAGQPARSPIPRPEGPIPLPNTSHHMSARFPLAAALLREDDVTPDAKTATTASSQSRIEQGDAVYHDQEEPEEFYYNNDPNEYYQVPNAAHTTGMSPPSHSTASTIATAGGMVGSKRQRDHLMSSTNGRSSPGQVTENDINGTRTSNSEGLDDYFRSQQPNPKRLSSGTTSTTVTDLTQNDDSPRSATGTAPLLHNTLHQVSLPATLASHETLNGHGNDESFHPWLQQDVYDLLHNTFQIQNFRDHQKEIIKSTLQGKDVFVIMRTGGGKSLTYQLPALLEGRVKPRSSSGPLAKVTFVISPLLSLIRDQEDQMNAFMPNSAISFTSGMKGGNAEHARRWQRVLDPQEGVCLVFVTPEKVHQSGKLRSQMQKLFQQKRLGRIVIDECHCACQWGHDFRPDYAKLGILKSHFPNIPVLAVTATASDKVRADCIRILGLNPGHAFFRSTANRPNLRYQIRVKNDSSASSSRRKSGGGGTVIDDMAAFIKEFHAHGAGIIYTYSRKDADTVADQLCDRGIVARSYHSDVSSTDKEYIHRSWMNNETQVVVATIAFGLGINKPDVRFVLHHSLSKTLEAYYQESGRAGRDGKAADCILYYSPKDVPRMIRLIHGHSGEELFWTMVKYAQSFGNDAVCRAIILNNLGEPNSPDPVEVLAANTDNVVLRNVASHARTALQLLRLKTQQECVNMTLNMLVKEWRAKSEMAPQCVRDNPPGKDLSTVECERIVVSLIEEGLIGLDVRWNAYDCVVYLVIKSSAQQFCHSNGQIFNLRVPKVTNETGSSRASSLTSLAFKAIPQANAGGWISTSTRKQAPKRKRATTKKSVGNSTASAKKRNASKRKAPPKSSKRSSSSKIASKSPNQHRSGVLSEQRARIDVIELVDSSDSESDDSSSVLDNRAVSKQSASLRPRSHAPLYKESPDDPLWDDDSENEFD